MRLDTLLAGLEQPVLAIPGEPQVTLSDLGTGAIARWPTTRVRVRQGGCFWRCQASIPMVGASWPKRPDAVRWPPWDHATMVIHHLCRISRLLRYALRWPTWPARSMAIRRSISALSA